MLANGTSAKLPTHAIGQVIRGFAYPFQGLGFISRNRLWGLTGAAIAVNVVLLVALIVVTINIVGGWLDGLESMVLGVSSADWWQSIGTGISVLLSALVLVFAVAVDALALVLVGQAVASPFLDMLSERVEALVNGTEPAPFSVGRTVRTVAIAVGDLVWGVLLLLVVNIPIWIIGLSVILAPFAAAASIAFNSLLLAHEFVGLPLTRRLLGYRQRWGVVWQHRWVCLGFGGSVTLMLLVPGLNLLLLPLCTVGGTLLFCDLKVS